MQVKSFPLKYGYYWQNNLPEKWRFDTGNYITTTVQAHGLKKVNAKSLMLKLHLFRRMSGILGIEFMPEDTGNLTIKLNFSDQMVNNEAVNIGLPKRFGEIVVEELSTMTLKSQLRGGYINVSYGAWHEVESTEFIFRVLSRSLIRILVIDDADVEISLIEEQITQSLELG